MPAFSHSLGLGMTAQPLSLADLVEAMWPKGMPFWNGRMLEVCIGVSHAYALHDCYGSQISECCEGHNLIQAKALKPDAKTLLSALSGIAVTPRGALQPPA